MYKHVSISYDQKGNIERIVDNKDKKYVYRTFTADLSLHDVFSTHVELYDRITGKTVPMSIPAYLKLGNRLMNGQSVMGTWIIRSYAAYTGEKYITYISVEPILKVELTLDHIEKK